MLTDSGGFQAFSLVDGPRRATLARRAAPRRASPSSRTSTARSTRSRRRTPCASRACSAPTSRCSSTCARRAIRRAPSSRPRSRAPRAGPGARSPRRDPPGRRSSGSSRGRASPTCAAPTPTSSGRLALRRPRPRRLLGRRADRADARDARRGRPGARPRAAALPHGRGHAARPLVAIGAGVDMFDCVLPTRNARNGQALTRSGRVVIKQARYKDDPRPIDDACACACCAGGYSRAYLRHLYLAGEILVPAAALAAQPALLRRARGRRPRGDRPGGLRDLGRAVLEGLALEDADRG